MKLDFIKIMKDISKSCVKELDEEKVNFKNVMIFPGSNTTTSLFIHEFDQI